MTVSVNYRCSLFDEGDAQQLLDGFMAVLGAAVEQPDGDIAKFHVVSDGS